MTQHIRITRSVDIPNPVKLARFRRAPELGPKVLFFSGGTALRELSRRIIDSTHNSVHLITPFDSGGSSAKLRQAFGMLAVGDLRNRLMALADRSVKGAPEIYELFAWRFPKNESPKMLSELLATIIRGRHPLVAQVPDPMRKIIRTHLQFFAGEMGPDFDLSGASVGNLILTGGFFNYGRHIDPVIFLFSKLVEARGTVRPIVNKDLHLAAELADGRVLVGQHLLTGKEATPLASAVRRLYLTGDKAGEYAVADAPQAVDVFIRDKITRLIAKAGLICYPPGSFYSSLVANLLPKGVGEAVSRAACPKIYVPSQGADPETIGMTLLDQVRALFGYLERGCDAPTPRENLLNFLLIDTERGDYGPPSDLEKIKRYGVEIIDSQLISDASAPLLDEQLVIDHILSLV